MDPRTRRASAAPPEILWWLLAIREALLPMARRPDLPEDLALALVAVCLDAGQRSARRSTSTSPPRSGPRVASSWNSASAAGGGPPRPTPGRGGGAAGNSVLPRAEMERLVVSVWSGVGDSSHEWGT